jgi:hypothetical protein
MKTQKEIQERLHKLHMHLKEYRKLIQLEQKKSIMNYRNLAKYNGTINALAWQKKALAWVISKPKHKTSKEEG